MTNDSALVSLRDVLGEVPQHDRQGYEFSIGDIHVGETDGAVVEVAAQAVVQASSPVFFRIIDLKPSSGKLVKVSPAAGLTRLQTGDLAIAAHGALAPPGPLQSPDGQCAPCSNGGNIVFALQSSALALGELQTLTEWQFWAHILHSARLPPQQQSQQNHH